MCASIARQNKYAEFNKINHSSDWIIAKSEYIFRTLCIVCLNNKKTSKRNYLDVMLAVHAQSLMYMCYY